MASDLKSSPRSKPPRMCSYSNCFRDAVSKRGFVYVCAIHKADPRKWGKDGQTFTGSVFVPNGGRP